MCNVSDNHLLVSDNYLLEVRNYVQNLNSAKPEKNII
jgi:hypothetical protein